MARYTETPITSSIKGKQMYETVRYPDISRLESDTYILTTIGDRYDTLAQQYYGDSNLWWVISNANGKLTKDSLTPPIGSQVRIPANPTLTLADYIEINE
tara:strand:+ start:5816 stop:6115 length:300 start_codon:yes stop_codon:yes gene_type:complete